MQIPSRPMSVYRVKTAVFEGPLDLLLQLITSHQVEITELSLSDLVTEYLDYLEVMKQLDLEVTSEFLLIAATLIQLKARYLLPDDVPIDIDEELALALERDRLLARLLACLTFKDVAAVLAHRLEFNVRYVPRAAGIDEGITPAPPLLSLPIGPEELAARAALVLGRPSELEVDHLDLELPSVDQAIIDVQQRMAETMEADFESLVTHCRRPVEVVAYFLAILELSRWGILRVTQEQHDAPIGLLYETNADMEGVEMLIAHRQKEVE